MPLVEGKSLSTVVLVFRRALPISRRSYWGAPQGAPNCFYYFLFWKHHIRYHYEPPKPSALPLAYILALSSADLCIVVNNKNIVQGRPRVTSNDLCFAQAVT
jgi:hypothetical protein